MTYHVLLKLGMSPARLKAFTLDARRGTGPRAGPRVSRRRSTWAFSSRRSRPTPSRWTRSRRSGSSRTTSRSTSSPRRWRSRSCRGIRARYPEWTHLLDGDGGDENLKDYPIEENPELTIRSVVSNPMLYQEGWGVGSLKHSLTPTRAGRAAHTRARTRRSGRSVSRDSARSRARASSRSPKGFRSRTSRGEASRCFTRSRARSSPAA